MPIRPTFLLIADIGGYTKFMRMHRMSLAHAQDIVGRLLNRVIDTAGSRLTLAKLEGDAAFFYAPYGEGDDPDLAEFGEDAARIHRAFHDCLGEMRAANLCWCDGCLQTGNLRIKFVAHFGEASIDPVRQWTELTGVDVIVVHRMLKNDVPVSEYLLATDAALRRLGDEFRRRAKPVRLDVADVGPLEAAFVGMLPSPDDAAPPKRRAFLVRLGGMLALAMRTMPALIGLRPLRQDAGAK